MVALAIAGAIVPAAAAAAQKSIWGPAQMPDGSSAFSLYRDLGVDNYQRQLPWSSAAPTRPANPTDPADPAYRWPEAIDYALAQGREHGIDVALLVTTAPRWANGDRSPEWAPTDPQDFADFVTAASRRYPSVRHWMIWGEPNLEARFKPNAPDDPVSARTYAPILDAAYAALKAVSPANVVIGGMTSSGGIVRPEPFLRAMRLPDRRPPRLDWFGHNPFPFRSPDLSKPTISGGFRDISDLDTFEFELRQVYAPLGIRPRMWLSEFTIPSDHASDAFGDAFVSREEQARWLTAAYEIADRVDSVEALGWFSLFDQRPETPSAGHWGLIDASGDRKPSFDAYRAAPSRRFRPAVRAPGQIRRRRFVRRGLRVRVRPKVAGVVVVRLVNRRGRLVRRARRQLAADVTASIRLRRRRLRRGSYRLVVEAARAESVTRRLRVLQSG